MFFHFSEKARRNKETHEESESTSMVSAEGKSYENRALREKRLLYSNYCTDISTTDILMMGVGCNFIIDDRLELVGTNQPMLNIIGYNAFRNDKSKHSYNNSKK